MYTLIHRVRWGTVVLGACYRHPGGGIVTAESHPPNTKQNGMTAVRLKAFPEQLALFPGRQRKPPATLEFPKQCVLADACDRWINPGWKWTHLPFGEYRSKATAGKLKRMGVKPGWPDLLFVSPAGQHHYIELKRKGGRLNDAQLEFQTFAQFAAIPYLCSISVEEIWAQLQAWGAVKSNVRI